jgi:lipopolysaccharide heptosyltransferase II
MHTLPLVSAIKAHDPTAYVGWLVESSAAGLLKGHPQIDRLHVSHRKRWLRQARNPLRWPAVLSEIRTLRHELHQAGYTISFDVQGLLKSAVWPFLARIPKRYGFKATRESADRFYTDTLPPMIIRDSTTFAVERYLDFARAIGCPAHTPEFRTPPIPAVVQQRVDELLGNSKKPLVVLAPFTRWPSKHWEMSYWPLLMDALLQQGVQLAILGAPTDQPAVERLIAALPQGTDPQAVLNLAGKTDWPDLYALFQRTRLLIGLDSAPLHVANAVGVPRIIGLYGPTAPGRTGPIGAQHATLSTALSCQPCFERQCPIRTHDCMRQLQPDMVAALAQRMLTEPMPTTPSHGIPTDGSTF